MESVPTRVWMLLAGILLLASATCHVRRRAAVRRLAAGQGAGRRPKASYSAAGLLLAAVLAWWLASRLDWSAFASWLVAVNVATFAFFGWDKLAAALALSRVPEASLHLLALVGGSIGALVGRDTFKHKTKKRKFQPTFWAVIALHVAIVVLYVRSRSAAA